MGQVVFTFNAGASNHTISTGFSSFALTRQGAFPPSPYRVTGAVITFSKVGMDSVYRGLQVYSNSPAVNASLLSTVALRHLGYAVGTHEAVAFNCDVGINYAGLDVVNLRSLQADASSAGALMSVRAGSSITITVTYVMLHSTLALDKTTLDAGQTLRANITAGDGAYTHRITWAFGDRSHVDAVAAGAVQIVFLVPVGWLDQVPAALSGTLHVTLETLLEGTPIGSEVKTAAVTVGAGVLPTIGSLRAERINHGVPAQWDVFVSGISRATLTMEGVAAGAGSAIGTYSITGAGLSVNAASGTTAPLAAGHCTYTAIVSDLRGRTATKTVDIAVVDYAKPVIRDVSLSRCDVEGKQDGGGRYIKTLLDYHVASVNGKNAAVVGIRLRPRGASAWEDAFSGALASGESVIIGGGAIALASSYEVAYTVADTLLHTAAYVDAVGTADVFIHRRAGGTGLGIGTYCEGDKRLQIAADWGIVGGTLCPSQPLAVISGGTGAGNAAQGAFNLLYRGTPPQNDLNRAFASGLYWVQAGMAGQPTSGGVHGIMVVHNLIADGAGSFVVQLLHGVFAPQKLWRRVCSTDGVWSRWYAFSGTLD